MAVWAYQSVKPSEQVEWLLLIEEMIQRGADIRYRASGTVLGTALLNCRATEAVVPLLLRYGANPNDPMGPLDHPSAPLKTAVGECPEAIVRLLLEKGANPIVDGDPTAIVKLARYFHRESLVPLLVQYGAVDGK
jgi:hypothetical protein